MKGKTIIQVFLLLVMLLSSSQFANAKKIVYLGHNYNGKVNDQNIPAGEGKIDIGGLKIEGVFEGKTINEATIATEWLEFSGTICYDRSNKVTLKKGGAFTKYYFTDEALSQMYTSPNGAKRINPYYLSDHSSLVRHKGLKFIKETLDQDKEIDNDGLSNETLNIPFEFDMEEVPSTLQPPHVKTHITYPLSDFKYIGPGSAEYKGKIYIVASESQASSNNIQNYKDEQDRLWSYAKGKGFLVTYPNKSWYYSGDGSWSVKCNEGYYHTYNGEHKILMEDFNISIKNFTGGTELSDFIRYIEVGKTDIVLPIGTQILLPYDDRYKAAEEIENNISRVLSYYKLGNPFGAKVFYLSGSEKDYNAYPNNQLGVYENGHYIPKKK